MRAVDAGHARDTTIRAGAVLASKPGDAVVGIIATGFDTEAAVDRQLAVIGKASAVFVVCASAAGGGEATRQVSAKGWKAVLAEIARVVGVTQCVRVGALRTERAGFAPGAVATGAAYATGTALATDTALAAGATVAALAARATVATDTAIRINRAIVARIAGKRRGGRRIAAGRDRSGQQEVSKESHVLRTEAPIVTRCHLLRSLARSIGRRIPTSKGP